MRLWSLHPSCLDRQGLAALWREGLLARKVLLGQTRGYQHHPQVRRFRACGAPILAIDGYLSRVLDEAISRGYQFDGSKICYCASQFTVMTVTSGQLAFELGHLRAKLEKRSPADLTRLENVSPHPLFRVVDGGKEEWEK